MKKIFFGILFMALLTVFSVPARANVDVNVNIGVPLPPAIVFSAPPLTLVIPGTYIYAVPDVPDDIFFYGGWWWRPWQGRWYRSPYYDRGWAHYKGVPSFYHSVPPRWREDYRNHQWKGHPWTHQRVPAQQLPGKWKGWEKNRHWEKQHYWGVPNMKPKQKAHQPPHGVKAPPPPHPSQQKYHNPPRPDQRDMDRPHPQQHGKEKHPDQPKEKHGKGEGGRGHQQGRD